MIGLSLKMYKFIRTSMLLDALSRPTGCTERNIGSASVGDCEPGFSKRVEEGSLLELDS